MQLYGLTGLKDLPPVHRARPHATPPEAIEHLLAVSAAHPTSGCVRLSDRLKFEGGAIGSSTWTHVANGRDTVQVFLIAPRPR